MFEETEIKAMMHNIVQSNLKQKLVGITINVTKVYDL